MRCCLWSPRRGPSRFHPISGLTPQQEYPGAWGWNLPQPFMDIKNPLPKTCGVFPHPTAPPASAPKAWLKEEQPKLGPGWDSAGPPLTWNSWRKSQPWCCWGLKTFSKATNENEFIFHSIWLKKKKKNLSCGDIFLPLKKTEFSGSKGGLVVNQLHFPLSTLKEKSSPCN